MNRLKQTLQLCLLGALIFALSACTALSGRAFEPMNQTMQRVDQRSQTDRIAKALVILLPGAYDKPQDFIDQGFVSAFKAKQFDADITLIDAHIGYYTNQQIVQRLLNEVILPAKQQGYQQIWLAGISLGGYGSLLYSMRGAQAIDGIFIMAPFMGSRHLPAQIAKAGGLNEWTPLPGAASVPLDIDDELWAWLKAYSQQISAGQSMVPIYIGYGEDDRFVASNRLLAAQLPSRQVMTVAGGHTWGPWLALWRLFLDRAPLPLGAAH
jgi:enterochelin esterase-like enzyme